MPDNNQLSYHSDVAQGVCFGLLADYQFMW